MPPLIHVVYIAVSLTSKAPFLCLKHIAFCPKMGFMVAVFIVGVSCCHVFALDVPKLCRSYDNKGIGSTIVSKRFSIRAVPT